MPKLKDNINERELLKYGYIEAFPGLYSSSCIDNFERIYIIIKNREIIFRKNAIRLKKIKLKWIKNLIEAGLVEGVEDVRDRY